MCRDKEKEIGIFTKIRREGGLRAILGQGREGQGLRTTLGQERGGLKQPIRSLECAYRHNRCLHGNFGLCL